MAAKSMTMRLSIVWREVVALVTGLLAELTDQSAYRRHLAAHNALDCPEEWRRFQDHQLAAKSRRGRCC